MQGSLGIERMCQWAAVSRAGFYRSLQERELAAINFKFYVGEYWARDEAATRARPAVSIAQPSRI
jgi:hypothetical protein